MMPGSCQMLPGGSPTAPTKLTSRGPGGCQMVSGGCQMVPGNSQMLPEGCKLLSRGFQNGKT